MTIQEEIVSWASSRSGWQQEALCNLASGKHWDDAELDILVGEVKAGGASAQKLTEADIPVATSTAATVSLRSIRDLQNVNALVPAQELNFAETGLTVIYGDNGSGKSGYARLIKSAVRSLHREDVHGNVFAAEQQPQHAELHYLSGSKDEHASWPPSQGAGAELTAVSFYDEACGDAYLEKESELGYRPSALVLLDGLIELCDRIKGQLDAELNANALEATALPDVPDGTESEKFLSSLSGRTTKADLDAACGLPPDSDAELNRLRQEEARMLGSNPSQEISRLSSFASQIRALAGRVSDLEDKTSVAAAKNADAALGVARTAREAAELASSANFDSEPLDGVGTEAWRGLWVAARKFSEGHAYPDQDFPVLDDAPCVLCQQPLSDVASERMRRFDTFVKATTATKADEAEHEVETLRAGLRDLAPEPVNLGAARASLQVDDEKLGRQVALWLEVAETRRLAMLDRLGGDPERELPDAGSSPVAGLREKAAAADVAAASIDEEQFNESLRRVIGERKGLEGKKALADHRRKLDDEVSRRKKREGLETARGEADTKGVTRKATELTEKYVTEEVRDRFTRETDRLRLERIHLAPMGGQKGKLRQRPQLLGANTTKPVREVLSEGEQTALGLAGFFTEAHFDPSKSGLVLDDPVSSLDHFRRRDVAKRLAELALDRQVIAFTHDLEFVVALSAAASAAGASFTERAVERRGQDPGVCVQEHPWKAKDVGRRLSELEQLLAEIKRERSGWGQQQYEQMCADWAGKLSETWERILHLEIAQPIFDLNSSEVRPKMLKVVARVTSEDEQQFQASYSRVSEWARRHDKSPSRNAVSPEPEELQEELDSVRDFFDRIKKYRS